MLDIRSCIGLLQRPRAVTLAIKIRQDFMQDFMRKYIPQAYHTPTAVYLVRRASSISRAPGNFIFLRYLEYSHAY